MSGNTFRGNDEILGFLILVGMVFTLLSFSPAILFYALARLVDRPRQSLTAIPVEAPPGPPGYPAWADYSYPGPLPNSPGQVGSGYPPSG